MFDPSFEEVLRLKDSYSVIPICRKVWSDQVTPIQLFQQIRDEYSFLFESVEGDQKWARYSFLGHNPFLLYTAKEGQGFVYKADHTAHSAFTLQQTSDEPITLLKSLLKKFRVPDTFGGPPFTGGAVGYVGYEAMTFVEELPLQKEQVFNQDPIRLMFCDEVIAFDHLQQELSFISLLHIEKDMQEEEVQHVYEQTCRTLNERIQTMFEKVQDEKIEMVPLPSEPPEVDWDQVRTNFERKQFLQSVEKIKSYIRAGDVFQTVLSQRFSVDVQGDPFRIYRVLRRVNPSPYLYYLNLGDGIDVIGSSPERLIRTEHGFVETNPIAGTRKRGATDAEDLKLAQELLSDEKERAEHHMLLDLGRNDVGKVSRYGTVEVAKHMEIEKFSHVMHICSTVRGELADGYDAVDSLLAGFPAGTVTGAPKLRAMEILAELEQDARHAYSGAVGYFSFSGNVDSCIAIRTLFVENGTAHIQAGAGIVYDSVPELEWQETRNKARALLVAVKMAEQQFQAIEKEEGLYV